MKVLFINHFYTKETIYREPLGIMYLASMIKPRHQVQVLEPMVDDIDKKISDFNPDVIAYSMRTSYHRFYLELNKLLKKRYDFLSVFGGPHPTHYPEMIEEEGVDAVCRSEAEEAFLEFMNTLEDGGDITKVRNFWVKISGKTYRNPIRPLTQDLDTLPNPDRTLFDDYYGIKNVQVRCFISGRGCPYDCTYCFNRALKNLHAGERYVRRRSVDHVINEVVQLQKERPFQIAVFEDDTFNMDKQWLREFAGKFGKLDIKLNLIGVRPELMTEEVVRMLKKANCYWVVFGLETGNPEVRRKLLGRHISNEQILNCSRLLKENNIECMTENILGIPSTTLENDLETLQLNVEGRPDFAGASLMTPYPGTEIYKAAVDQGLVGENSFDALKDFYDKPSLVTDNFRERENLQRLFNLAVQSPFLYKHIKFLIKLPLGFFYTFCRDVYKSIVGIRWLPFERSFGEYGSIIYRYYFYPTPSKVLKSYKTKVERDREKQMQFK